MILDEFFKPNSINNLTERVTFDANGNPIYPNLQNLPGVNTSAAPATATDDDDDATEPPMGSTPVAPAGGSAQLQNPAARAEYQRVRSTADKFSFSNPEFRKEYDRIARSRDTASNRIMSGNRSYSPEPALAARQHQELVKMLYQIDADFVQGANMLLKNYGALKEQGMAESLGDLRPTLGSKRDQGKSVRKWRRARGLGEQDMDNDNLQGGRSDDEVKFFIDSEPAYYAVMDRFGDHIEFRGEDMVAPLRLWGAIQQTAGDAGGAADIAGLEDEPMWVGDELDEQDMAEGKLKINYDSWLSKVPNTINDKMKKVLRVMQDGKVRSRADMLRAAGIEPNPRGPSGVPGMEGTDYYLYKKGLLDVVDIVKGQKYFKISKNASQGVLETNVAKYKDLGATNQTTHFIKNVTTGKIVSPHRSLQDAEDSLVGNMRDSNDKFKIVRARKGVAEGSAADGSVNYTLGHTPDAEYVYSIYRDGKKEGTYHSVDQAREIMGNMKRTSPNREYKIKRGARNKMAGPAGQLPEQGIAEAHNFKGSFPFDVDHMGGTRGINLPSAPTKKFFDDKKQWSQAVDDINSSKYDDNSDYIGVTGRTTVSIDGREWARWSDAQEKGYIEMSSMTEQDISEAPTDDPRFQKMMGNIQKSTPALVSGYVALNFASEQRSKKIKGVSQNGKPMPDVIDNPEEFLSGKIEFTPDQVEKQLMAIGKKYGWDSIDSGQGQGYTEMFFDTSKEYTSNNQNLLAANIANTVNAINKFFNGMNNSLQATGLPGYKTDVWQGMGPPNDTNQIGDLSQIANIAKGKSAKSDPGTAIGKMILKYIPSYEAENDELGYDPEDFASAMAIAKVYIAQGEEAGLRAQLRAEGQVSDMIDELISDAGGSGLRTMSSDDLAEGHGNYAGDRPVNLGGVSMKKIQIGDTVRYIDQKAQVIDMSRDRERARITIPSSATTKTVLTSDLRQLGRGVSEGNDQQLSVQQLATVSDEALDTAYGYGRSSPGNTFGWQANLKSAAYAKQMIDQGVTDIEAISDAIHQGWNTTAQAFVQNPEQFDDTEKLRAAGKLEAKLQQRAKLMNIDYDQLPDDEQEKDRVVARALLQALTGQQDAATDNKQLDELSPATLARYKTKAGAAATAADSAGDRKTGDRRFSGIVKATKKQFDQDAKQSAQAVHESRLSIMASIIKTQ